MKIKFGLPKLPVKIPHLCEDDHIQSKVVFPFRQQTNRLDWQFAAVKRKKKKALKKSTGGEFMAQPKTNSDKKG